MIHRPAVIASMAVGVGAALWFAGPPPQLQDGDVVAFVVSAARLLALAMAAYLVLVALLATLTARRQHGLLARLTRLVTLPALHRSLSGGILLLGIASPAGAASPPSAVEPETATLQRISPEANGETTGFNQAETALLNQAEMATMTRLPDTSIANSKPAETWTVASGDHLWQIAEETLSERLDHAPSTAEVTSYWSELIEINRDQLVDASNPDLVFPGQRFVLPRGMAS